MGISTNYYTVYGIKHEWDSSFMEAYDEVYDDADTPCIIADAMGGEYIIFGHTFYDSGDLRWCDDLENGIIEIDIDDLATVAENYKAAFIAKFPNFKHLVDASFKLMTFVHYH